ncbi:NAP-domain-containing protein [Backusella circina FSU 941]|nr:NAP-domain-containing protein [Backusella circina FSU 941]
MDPEQKTGVDIKNKATSSAPTPQNTPINPAHINSTYRPSIPAISEDDQSEPTKKNGNNHLINMLHGKLGTIVGNTSFMDTLPSSVKRRINGIKYFQSKHAELETKFQEEVLALEKKYIALYQPLYDKRARIVNGTYEPTDKEVTLGKTVDGDETQLLATEDDIKGIPEFWLTLLKNQPIVSQMITKKDERALTHLVDIRMVNMEKPGFKFEFEFTENDYFSNKLLTKSYYYQNNIVGGDFIYQHADGCEINWKKNLLVKTVSKVQRQKETNKTQIIKRQVSTNSFFRFFSPPRIPEMSEDLDEEEADKLDMKLEADYEVGEIFKDKVIPYAVDYFTGKALEYEDYENSDDYEDIDDEAKEVDESNESDGDDEEDVNGRIDPEKVAECKQS